MKKSYLSIILSFLFYSNLYSQSATINGIVNDKTTAKTLQAATITIDFQKMQTLTNEDGKFTFSSLHSGMYTIEINKIGYKSQLINVTITDNEIKNISIDLESKSTKLATVEVFSDKPVTAASSTYISKIDFENRPKNSAQDMLRLVPGLFIAQHAGGGKAEQIFIRGFDCDHGTDVATYMDGMPVNMPSHGHGQGYEDLHFLIPEVVKGMDVFKGPYSPKFGDFATGAAVQFNTLDSIDNNLIQLESGAVAGIKGVSSKRGLALLKLPEMGSNITSYIAADVVNNRGYFENSQHFNRISLFAKTSIAVTEHSHVHFSVSSFGSSWDASGQVPERAVNAGLISRFGSIDNSEGGTTQRNNISLTYHMQVEASEFETQIYSSNYRFKLFSNFTFFLNDSINGDEIEQDDNRTIRGLNSHYSISHKLGKMNNKFTLGYSYRADEIENELWHASKRIRLDEKANALIHERSSGIYANELFRFSDHFRTEVGGRYDYFIFDVEDQLPTDSTHANYSGYNYQTLLSPKLNFIYSPSDRLQFFLNAGSGFHSNDARSVVQQSNVHNLPRADGAEIGTLFHLGNRFVFSTSIWWMDLENELVYVGDDGTTEIKGPSRRTGIDFSARQQFSSWLYADVDVNVAKNVFINKLYGTQLENDYHIPLAPILTSVGGLTAKFSNGFEAGIRYRYLAERPANESNTVKARKYTVLDLTANYKTKHYKIGVIIENLLNTKWNEAQFDTESRLPFEAQSVDELHFTPGTPLAVKLLLGYIF